MSACKSCGKPYVGVWVDAGSDAQRREMRCRSCGATGQLTHLTTGKVYKVWLEIEEYDIEEEQGELLPSAVPCTATFATSDEAEAFAQQMHDQFTNEGEQVTHD